MFVSNGDGTASDGKGNTVPLTVQLKRGVSADAFIATTRTGDTTADASAQPVLAGLGADAPGTAVNPDGTNASTSDAPTAASSSVAEPAAQLGIIGRLRALTTTQKLIGAAVLFGLVAWFSDPDDDGDDDEGSDE